MCTLFQTVLGECNGLCTLCISGLPTDEWRFCCAQWQGDGVVVLGWHKAWQEFTVDIDSLQSVVGELCYSKLYGIGIGGSAVGSCYMDGGSAIGAAWLGDGHSRTCVLRGSAHHRHFGGAIRQLHIVGIEVSIEALDAVAIHLNIRQTRIVGRCGNEFDLVGGTAATIGGVHLNDHWVAIDSTLLHNLKLIIGEFATRERGFVAAGIGESTYTAYTKDSWDICGFAH